MPGERGQANEWTPWALKGEQMQETGRGRPPTTDVDPLSKHHILFCFQRSLSFEKRSRVKSFEFRWVGQ